MKQVQNGAANKEVPSKKNMDFQQLIQHNTAIIESMKNPVENLCPPSANLVTKATSPRS